MLIIPGTTCPSGLTQTGYININHDVCGLSGAGCDSTFFSTYAFNSGTSDIDSFYVDGVSITYGSNPRQHIWTYAGGWTETLLVTSGCPCNSGSSASPLPSFVGNDYYCESGRYSSWSPILYPEDPLWDGQNCNGPESTCCTNPNMPWFLKTFDEIISDDIELRMCSDEGIHNEDTPLDIIEIYVK